MLPALAELYGVTADDILAGETRPGRPAEGGGEARDRLLRLRLRTRFDLCVIGSLALGVLAAFQVAYVSLAAWPVSVGLLWIGYVLAAHPARYGDVALDTGTWENLYRKLLTASAVQWWALLRLVRLGRLELDFAEMRYYDTMDAWKPLIFAVGLAVLCAVLERALRRRAGAEASLLWVPERLRPTLCRGDRFLRRTRQIWLAWLVWAVVLAGLWFLADGQVDRALSPWIAQYGEDLVRSGFPENWTILRGRLEADVGHWIRLRQGVVLAGAVSGAGVLIWTLMRWKKSRRPLAEKGET